MRSLKILFLLSLVIFLSCKKKLETNGNEEARKLYEKSIELIQDYTNRLENLNDLASIDSISNLFEKKLVDLNFKFPPNTDLRLSEQENDSLYCLLHNYRNLKEKKIKNLVIPPSDSNPIEREVLVE